jgi:hypothetical protein
VSRTAASTESIGVGKGALAALIVVGTALALLLIVRARPAPDPFDPRSSAANGATALVELFERSGGEVAISRTVPAPGADTRLLVLADQLDDEQRSATVDFIEAGGVAIVADPFSTLHGGPALEGGSIEISGPQLPTDRLDVDLETNLRAGECNIAALESLRGLYVPEGLLFPVGPSEPQCFARNGNSFVIVNSIGDGFVVGLGDNEVFVNRYLRRADNAGLAVALLTPAPGSSVSIVLGTGATAPVSEVGEVGEGEDTLIDLVPDWAWMALVLVGSAFVVFAVSRSIRVGGVLDEPLVTPIAGSELVAATGNLMQRAKHAPKAGWLLQTQLHRDLCREFRIDTAAPLVELDAAVAARSSIPSGDVDLTLRQTASNDAQLLALSGQIDRIRKEVLT